MDSNNNMNSTSTDNKQASCKMYYFVMPGIIGLVFTITGIVCNIGSLLVFRHRVVKTPTTYQLQWLALMDTIFLVLCFVCENLAYINFLHIGDDTLYWQVIFPYIAVFVFPFFNVAETSTNWLTVFIGVYRYMAICKPVSNSYRHIERHRRKYVVILLSLAVLCNIPYFFVLNLSQNEDGEHNKVSFSYILTSFGKSDSFKLVYHNIMHPAFTVCLPFVILFIITVKMMVALSKKHSNMQNSNMLNLNINTVIITILLTFIICRSPILVNRVLMFIYNKPTCGSVYFYFSGLVPVFLVLNTAARPFTYMVLRNHFTWPLRHNLRNERAESIEMGSM